MTIRADSRLGRFIGALGYRPTPRPSTGDRGIQPGSMLGRFLGALASPPAPASLRDSTQTPFPAPRIRQSSATPPRATSGSRQRPAPPFRPVLNAPQGGGVATQVRIIGETDQDLGELGEWLRQDRRLGDWVITGNMVADTPPGTPIELIAEAISSRSLAAALVTSLQSWVATRRTSVTITISTPKGSASITLDRGAANVAEFAALLTRTLEAPGGH
jgi:hypothetical protein